MCFSLSLSLSQGCASVGHFSLVSEVDIVFDVGNDRREFISFNWSIILF